MIKTPEGKVPGTHRPSVVVIKTPEGKVPGTHKPSVAVIKTPEGKVPGKGLVINYGEGGATKWENCGSETFCPPPPPQDRVKLFAPPLLKSGNITHPPLQYG